MQVPIYFTIQPGGAYVKVLNPGTGPKGARLIYPNGFNFKPGTPFEFWNYDADVKGWFIYGQGKVSADGRSVIPDPGVVLYEFTGAMVGAPGDAPSIGKPVGSNSEAGDPVDLSTGQFIYSKTDLALPDVIPISFTRLHRAAVNNSAAVAKILLQAGSSLTATGTDDWMPLHLAAISGSSEVVELLIAAGADVDALSKFGDSPLHLCVTSCDVKSAEMLLRVGANPYILNKKGLSPLDKAQSQECTPIAELLERWCKRE